MGKSLYSFIAKYFLEKAFGVSESEKEPVILNGAEINLLSFAKFI